MPASGQYQRRKGTSRSERHLPALAPEFARLDERNMCDMLFRVWEISGQINFFDQDNLAPCTWRNLLETAPIVALSVIARLPDKSRGSNLMSTVCELSARDGKESAEHVNQLLETLRSIANEYASEARQWRKMVTVRIESPDEDLLMQEACQLVESYDKKTLHYLTVFDEKLDPGNCTWKRVSDALVQDRRRIQEQAALMLEQFIEDTGRHQAHIGLMLAFLNLFRDNQNQLNEITDRHLYHHFRDVLHLENRQPCPDKAVVEASIVPKREFVTLAAGTEFSAGRDSLGKEQIYRLETQSTLSQTTVEDIRSVLTSRHSDGCVKVRAGDQKSQTTGDNKDLFAAGWPMFGVDVLPLIACEFGIASPLLRLTEGRRQVDLCFDLNIPENVSSSWWELVSGFCVSDSPSESVDKDGELNSNVGWRETFDAEETIYKLPNDLFAARLTADGGWLEVAPSSVALARSVDEIVDKTKLIILCRLDESQPALVDYCLDIHEEGLKSSWPIILMELQQKQYPILRGLLEQVVVDGCRLSVDVQGMSALSIETDVGRPMLQKPFIPFGPQPRQGSAFEVLLPDALRVAPGRFKLSWDWVDAPSDFMAYYENYHNWKNAELKLKVRSGRLCRDLEGKNLRLFGANSRSVEGSLGQVKVGQNSINYPTDHRVEEDQQPHQYQVLDALRLELTNLEDPFGHIRYPKILNAQPRRRTDGLSIWRIHLSLLWPCISWIKKSKSIPPPYLPVFQNLTLDFSASQDVRFETLANDGNFLFMRRRTFGFETCLTQTDGLSLVAPEHYEGQLILGLAGLKSPQPVSIHFLLDENASFCLKTDTSGGRSDVKWFYLFGNKWCEFSRGEITLDTTDGLQQSGIITFQIPTIADDQTTILPGKLNWLRAAVRRPGGFANPLLNLHTNALPLMFDNQHNDPQRLSKSLPAGSITRLTQKTPGVQSVEQHYDSYGGSPAECDQIFRERVSERLQHKNRAVVPWDYERLVLRKFPQLARVVCLPHTNRDMPNSPGHVTLVIVPQILQVPIPRGNCPIAGQQLCYSVENFLRPIISPSVTLYVVPPEYEPVQIHAVLSLTTSCDEIWLIEQIHKSIEKLLAPWRYDVAVMSLAHQVMGESIADILGEFSDVCQVENLSVFHNGTKYSITTDGQPEPDIVLIGSKPLSVLTCDVNHIIVGRKDR